ncbi:MAG: aminotransferase class [Crocinitomicaceae bacterium]|jgi:7-keto-8-aminopelargonate synthetase-like enzyme|nr:aminotransferase class [Crocinitomicaceae bacterium]
MAKIKHHSFNETINDLLTEAKSRGVIQLKYNSKKWEGSHMKVGKQRMRNFGTCGYMGLESHPRIIKKSIEYAQHSGTQFSVSRTYLMSDKTAYLEDLLSEIFDSKPVLTYSSTSLLHISVLPAVVEAEDAIILDQQCHASIQTAAQLMRAKGVPVDIVRHSNLEMLEYKIKQMRDKYSKIWYMIDGVYSMYGDVAPIDEINALMEKYPQLHLYVDDAHGMSWFGKHGCGRIYKEAKENKRTIYVTTMAKGFGVMGGIAVFPDDKWFAKVSIYGGALTHSHPIPPPMLGASIASAKIHLSDEIYTLQASLKEKLDYANKLFAETNLPVISNPETPIFFLCTGQPVVGYNLNKRILDDGFYVNIAMFPAVPLKNTGLRFTITNHNSLEDIKALVDALVKHYPLALEQEGKTLNDVRKAFHLPLLDHDSVTVSKNAGLEVSYEQSIKNIRQEEWDNAFANKGNYDYAALVLLEEAFSGNDLPEENWDFHYVVVRNSKKEIVLATFFTSGLFKEDLLSPVHISNAIEEKRVEDKYFLCSRFLMMGSLVTEGEHMYLDRSKTGWEKAVRMLLEKLAQIQEKEDLNTVILRDFNEDEPFFSHFHENSYLKIQMPDTNVITGLVQDKSQFFSSLSARSRRHIKDDVLKFEHHFRVECADTLEKGELNTAYSLFLNVSSKSRGINEFAYPFSFFSKINESPDWEFIKLYIGNELASVGFCHKAKGFYNPLIVGLDYGLNAQYNSYKQMLYQVCLRAIDLKYSEIHFGFSADVEKKKLGAKQIKKVAFLQLKDQFNFEVIENYNHNIV